ncbi:hypothetical protein BH09BAC5_BH09BAC5_21190 [soil metagenome]
MNTKFARTAPQFFEYVLGTGHFRMVGLKLFHLSPTEKRDFNKSNVNSQTSISQSENWILTVYLFCYAR